MNTLRLFQAPQPGRLKLSEGIEDFVSYLVVERNCPNTTIRAYRNDLLQLAEFLGDKPASTVTIADLRAWLESMDLAPSTIGRKLATARSYFRFGVREGWADKNTARELDMPRRDKILPRVLTEEQVTTILDCVESKRDRAILEVLYAGGLRVSELVGLDVDDIGESHIRVFGKGGVERICPIGRKAVESLHTYVDERGDQPGPLFLNRFGNRLSDRAVRIMIDKYASTNPHAFRHSYATHLIDHGADIRDVQDLLGHRSITSTQIYTHVSPVRKIIVYNKCHPRA